MPKELGHVPPKPTNAAKRLIHSFAEEATGRLKFTPGAPIEPLVARLGGEILYRAADEKMPNRLPESIIVRSKSDFTIFVPTMTSAERDRFTIAHELGHLLLHYPMVLLDDPKAIMAATRWVDENDPVQRRAEWEANWFAAAFLMPLGAFKDSLEKWQNDLNWVAIMFGVSKRAA